MPKARDANRRAVIAVGVLLAVTMTARAASSVNSIRGELNQGRCQEALAALVPLIKASPDDATLRLLQGRARLALHQVKGAVDSLRAAVKAAPDNARAQFWLGQALSQRIPEASLLSKTALASDLREAYHRAVELAPDDVAAREALMDFYLQAPGFFGGSMSKAREQAAAIAKLDPARGARARAVIAASRNDTDTAFADYRKAIDLAPNSAALRIDLGEYYLSLGHAHEACEVLQQALNLAPHDVEALEQLGAAAMKSGRTDDLQAGLAATRQLIADQPETARLTLAQQRQREQTLSAELGRAQASG